MSTKKKASKRTASKKKVSRKKVSKKNKELTVKEEDAAQAFIENGGNKSAAYRTAFDAEKMADKTVWEAASRLFKKAKVAARVIELMEHHLERHDVTIDSITNELNHNRTIAQTMGQASAMNQATLGKAKVHGLLVDKQEHTGKDGEPLDTIWIVKVMR